MGYLFSTHKNPEKHQLKKSTENKLKKEMIQDDDDSLKNDVTPREFTSSQ